MQLGELSELSDDGLCPDILRRHMVGTEVLGAGEGPGPWVDVLRRYRDEWMKIIEKGQERNWQWARWLSLT